MQIGRLHLYASLHFALYIVYNALVILGKSFIETEGIRRNRVAWLMEYKRVCNIFK